MQIDKQNDFQSFLDFSSPFAILLSLLINQEESTSFMFAQRSILRAIKFLYPQTTRQRHEQLNVIVKLENETDSGRRILQF